MGAGAPQWLISSFTDAMIELGATAPVDRLIQEAHALVEEWSDERLALHNLHHLINVLTRIDELSATAHDPDVLRVAAWYRGATLNRCIAVKLKGIDPQATVNECVANTAEHMESLGVSEDVTNRIGELIGYLAKHRAPRDDVDAQVLVDADLALLAGSPQEYKKYREKLRNELADLEDTPFLKARRALITKLLSYDPLYQSPLGSAWEDAARSNLEVELAKIDSALCQCGDTNDDVDDTDDSDDAPEEDLTTTGTIVLKRRHLKKNVATVETPADELTMTGTLPKIVIPAEPVAPEDDETTSSLESAIEAMDLPANPA